MLNFLFVQISYYMFFCSYKFFNVFSVDCPSCYFFILKYVWWCHGINETVVLKKDKSNEATFEVLHI